MNTIRKNDTVVVLTGRDKEKKGTVLEIDFPAKKILVKGIAVVVRHKKARRQGEVSGMKRTESFINLSNVMPVCPSCKKPCRINTKDVNNKKVRICNRCKEVF